MTTATLTETAVISGVASSPQTDAYGHSVRVGAFDASIARRGLTGPASVKLLASHAGLPIGRITSLRTVGQDLRLQAELNMELAHVRDLYSTIKFSGGLNYSVGFSLQEFDLVDEKTLKPGEPWLIIRKGDLTEISVVTFPALAEATMDLTKTAPAAADWAAFMARARLDQFRLKLQLKATAGAIRSRREQARLEHEALRRVKAPPRWLNI